MNQPKNVRLSSLAIGETLYVQTVNTRYEVQRINDDGDFLIKGNPKYCPIFTLVRIPGCNFGGSMLKLGALIEGCYMEFIPQHGPHSGATVITSRIAVLERMN